MDGSYLALVSDQNLRTIVIAGRPELGSPDWRMNVPGRPMSAQEMTDVVAWIASQRPEFPGSRIPVHRWDPRREQFHEDTQLKDHGARLLVKAGLLLNGIVGAILAVPIVRYLLSPVPARGSLATNRGSRSANWSNFPRARPGSPPIAIPIVNAWDGETGDIPCWVRNLDGKNFQVFAINCAHLGCPVRWFPQSNLFMCPCHGGVYYADGSLAAGPPERGLFEYQHKVEDGKLLIKAGEMPTPGSRTADTHRRRPPCA